MREGADAAFRNRKVAAPLKQVALGRGVYGDICLPQPKGCGPIEAAWPSAPSSGGGPLPQPKGCGPIEARMAGALAGEPIALPQPKGCGPIEASTCRRGRPTRAAFRNRKVAAPLKRFK